MSTWLRVDMHIDPADLLARICVSPPYFALRDLVATPEGLVARAVPDSPSHRELGAMPAAELSRHAAIAGLCAAALGQTDGERCFYLATRALYVGAVGPDAERHPVSLRAELVALEKRTARARVSAAADGRPGATLDVAYTVLAAATFARLFRDRTQATPRGALGQAPLPEGIISRSREGLRRDISAVPVACCAGHFHDFPSLPVAILMGELAAMCGRILDAPFVVARADVSATELVWAGAPVSFSVRRLGDDGRRALFDCRVSSGSATTATMHLTAQRC